jgi:hypothetical protein
MHKIFINSCTKIFSIRSIFLILEFNSTKLLFLLINLAFKKEGVLISIKFCDLLNLLILFYFNNYFHKFILIKFFF